MTKIDFYIAPESKNDAADNIALSKANSSSNSPTDLSGNLSVNAHWLVACRVVEKAYRKNMHVYVHMANKPDANAFDALLWSYRPNAFVPHHIENTDAPECKVIIGCFNENPSSEVTKERQPCELLVNLSGQQPEFFSRYLRLAEVVSANAEAKSASRERYKYYQDRGYPLAVHQL